VYLMCVLFFTLPWAYNKDDGYVIAIRTYLMTWMHNFRLKPFFFALASTDSRNLVSVTPAEHMKIFPKFQENVLNWLWDIGIATKV